MTRTARKSMNEQAESKTVKAVPNKKKIRLSLIDLASRMYEFLCRIKNNHSCFNTFPNQCCYYSTFFTAIVLDRLGYDTVFWVFGYRESTGAHVWCECNRIFIDLTASQYSDSPFKFIVDEKTSNTDTFHASFQIADKGFFDNQFKLSNPFFDLLPIVDEFVIQILTQNRTVNTIRD